MKVLQNKFFLICLCVAVILCVVTSTFAVMGYVGIAKNIVGTVTYPVRWVFTKIGDGFEGLGRYFEGVGVLVDENESLREENESLKSAAEHAAIVEAENERLRRYLDMKLKYPSFTFEEGTVIGYSAGNFITEFTLNRGSVHGIERGMAVVTEAGIVGQVTAVGLNFCTVSTLIDADTSIGIYLPRSGEVGIVSGDYSLSLDGYCKITYLSADADVEVGDAVLSSGGGSVYPPDLAVGYVTAVEKDKNSRTLVATVRPAVETANLRQMMILTGYEK